MPDSDYDLVWYSRTAPTSVAPRISARARSTLEGSELLDVVYSCPLNLAQIAREPGWWTPGYASARVLVDKTGEVEQLSSST